MDDFLTLSAKDRHDAFLITSEEMKINSIIVEKDFWVCYLLSVLFHISNHKELFAFKGGTSLSKGYEAIQRFSEDIDLVLDWTVLGYEPNTPWEERSKNQQDKLNKKVKEEAETWIDEVLRIELEEIITVKIPNSRFSISPDDSQTLLFHYPSVLEGNIPGVQKIVRLEIGPLAAMLPSEILDINSYVSELFPDLFTTGKFSVTTVTAERTFWEKATILHKEAHDENGKMPTRYSRHYYDLYKMSLTDIKQKAFENSHYLSDVVKFKKKFYPQSKANYDLAVLKEIKLYPNDNHLAALEEDYSQMSEMIFGEIIPFPELLKGIKLLEEEIHLIGS